MAGALAAAGLAQTGSTDPNTAGPSGTPGATAGTLPAPDMNTRGDRGDAHHDFNMGWFGLVGLLGLLGLRRPSHHTEPRSIDNTGPGAIR